ncbi:membrane protein [Bacteroidia bacterium]|nr:membrane protein [Bacteroidia bacterium]
MVFFSGCEDLSEDPRANITQVSYFKTPEELEGTLAAMYRMIAEDDGWGQITFTAPYFGADDLSTHPASNKADVREFDRMEGSAGNGSLSGNTWTSTYKAVYQANAILTVIDQVKFTNDAQKNGAVGQAYFMRALMYFYLVRTFGPIPIVIETTDVSEKLNREPVESVYTLIIDDLKQAETLLPETWGVQAGKATKYAAKALLADVYLNSAGHPLNQTANYALAAAKAKEVIDSHQYTLVPNYGDVFKTNNNSESIFALQYNYGQGVRRRSVGQFAVSEDEASIKGQTGWNDFCAEVNFYKNAPKCERTDETFLTILKTQWSPGDSINPDGTPELENGKPVPKAKVDTLGAWDDLKTVTQHPYYKKYRYGVAAPGTTMGDAVKETDTQILEINNSSDKTLDIIRYATVLLNYAEASAMAGSPTADSYNAINQVRFRAGLPDLTPGLSQTAFRDSVVHERAYECAAELGIRWFDIVRLKLLPQVIAARETGEYQVNQYWENKLNPTFTAPNMLETRYLAPIPNSQMLRNPHWTQNAGY